MLAENATTPLLETIADLEAQVQKISGEISEFEPLANRLQLLQSVMFEFNSLSAHRLEVGAPAPAKAAQAVDSSSRYLQLCELFVGTMLKMNPVTKILPFSDALEQLQDSLTNDFCTQTLVSLNLSDRPLFALLLCVRLLEARGAVGPAELLCLWKLKFDPELLRPEMLRADPNADVVEDEAVADTVNEKSPIVNLGDIMWIRVKHIAKQLKPRELALK